MLSSWIPPHVLLWYIYRPPLPSELGLIRHAWLSLDCWVRPCLSLHRRFKRSFFSHSRVASAHKGLFPRCEDNTGPPSNGSTQGNFKVIRQDRVRLTPFSGVIAGLPAAANMEHKGKRCCKNNAYLSKDCTDPPPKG